MDDEPRTLKSIFTTAETLRNNLSSSPTSLETALTSYTEAAHLTSQLSLFSPNETLEDIPTSSLPYLLIPLHIADLSQRLPTSSPPERLALLSRARSSYEAFLSRLDSYALLPPEEAKLYTLYAEDPATFSTTGSAASDPNARRNAKIANFKRAQAQRARLDELLRDPRYAAYDDDEHRDDEAVRAVYTAQITSAAHEALQSLEGLAREEEVLRQAPVPLMSGDNGWGDTPRQEDERHRRASVVKDGSERVELIRLRSALGGSGPLLDKGGKPLQPFTIVGGREDRAEMARGVFRPGHNLPTMSIDEYLAEERRRGGIIEGGGEASWKAGEVEPDEDDFERADRETMKAREWDEYVEANPKGAGNTMNRG